MAQARRVTTPRFQNPFFILLDPEEGERVGLYTPNAGWVPSILQKLAVTMIGPPNITKSMRNVGHFFFMADSDASLIRIRIETDGGQQFLSYLSLREGLSAICLCRVDDIVGHYSVEVTIAGAGNKLLLFRGPDGLLFIEAPPEIANAIANSSENPARFQLRMYPHLIKAVIGDGYVDWLKVYLVEGTMCKQHAPFVVRLNFSCRFCRSIRPTCNC